MVSFVDSLHTVKPNSLRLVLSLLPNGPGNQLAELHTPQGSETADKATAKKETADKETAKKETADKETAKKETAKKETAKKETADKETADKETADKETADKGIRETPVSATTDKETPESEAARVRLGQQGLGDLDSVYVEEYFRLLTVRLFNQYLSQVSSSLLL